MSDLPADLDKSHWRPSADLAVIRLRADLLSRTRQFFFERQVMEVETPILSHAGNPDIYIESFRSEYEGPGGHQGLYLQTSPEFAMKRLLAAGSGPVFQICKAFRNEELGRIHNPEFTMLEWYRPGFDHHQLMAELQELIIHLGVLEQGQTIQKLSYQQLFQTYAGLDPHKVGGEACLACIREHDIQLNDVKSYANPENLGYNEKLGYNRDALLAVILTHVIEPELAKRGFVFVYDYPQSQASLARIRSGETPVAERFELYGNGLELANGFNELTDKTEQLERFCQDQALRQSDNKQEVDIDQLLIEALDHGLPDCAGVAVGFDRLLMLAAGKNTLDEVLAFPFGKA